MPRPKQRKMYDTRSVGRRRFSWLLFVIGAVVAIHSAVFALPDLTAPRGSPLRPTTDWESNIATIERNYARFETDEDAVVFVGSSSIVRWRTLAEDFPDIRVINAGFGGSQIIDSVYYADRIVIPFAPHTVVFFAGSNDISAGKHPTQVLADYVAFVERVHKALPQTTIVFISISPSPRRWSQHPRVIEANRLIELYTETDDRLEFVDIYEAMLGPDGTPQLDLYDADELHLSPKGYDLWVKAVQPYLSHPYQPITLTGPKRHASVMSPVTLEARVRPDIAVDSAQVTVGDYLIYAADEPPTAPLISPYLPDGRHLAVFEVKDHDGGVQRRSLRIDVRNVDISVPTEGPFVQDVVFIELSSAYDASAISQATVTMTPVRLGELQHDEKVTLYHGPGVPETMTLDSLTNEDATYEVLLSVETIEGHLAQDAVRIVVRNWQKMTDPFAPPQESGWFGTVDRKKTIFESAGWDYATADREAFFNDAERRIWSGVGDGHLIWEVPALSQIVITLYARHAEFDHLSISVSEDQEDWQTIPFEHAVLSGLDSPWQEVVLTGAASDPASVRFVRVTLGEELPPDVVQLGEVEFIYPAPRSN